MIGVESLGREVRAIREQRGLTFREAAEQIGVTHSYLWKIENGVSSPTADTLLLIAGWAKKSIICRPPAGEQKEET